MKMVKIMPYMAAGEKDLRRVYVNPEKVNAVEVIDAVIESTHERYKVILHTDDGKSYYVGASNDFSNAEILAEEIVARLEKPEMFWRKSE